MKINHPLVEGEIVEIKPFIYAVVIKDTYDRAMLFCRYQEFYESPYSEIRGKEFTLESYMRLYTKRNKKLMFSYPYDWYGYNIPSNTIKDALKTFKKTKTQYDEIMGDIIDYCEMESRKSNNDRSHLWYVIGVDKLKSSTMNHEIAHGLYYTNLHYKVEMDYVITHMDKRVYKRLCKELIKKGYADDKKILDDEIQAFMSTGKLISWSDEDYKMYSNEFTKIFKKYNSKS